MRDGSGERTSTESMMALKLRITFGGLILVVQKSGDGLYLLMPSQLHHNPIMDMYLVPGQPPLTSNLAGTSRDWSKIARTGSIQRRNLENFAPISKITGGKPVNSQWFTAQPNVSSPLAARIRLPLASEELKPYGALATLQFGRAVGSPHYELAGRGEVTFDLLGGFPLSDLFEGLLVANTSMPDGFVIECCVRNAMEEEHSHKRPEPGTFVSHLDAYFPLFDTADGVTPIPEVMVLDPGPDPALSPPGDNPCAGPPLKADHRHESGDGYKRTWIDPAQCSSAYGCADDDPYCS